MRNSAYGIVEFAWPVALAILVTPYVVNGLGADAYGVLSIVAVTLGFLGLLDLGLGGAAIRTIAEHIERDEHVQANIVLGTVLGAYLAIGVVGGVALVLATPLLVDRVLAIPAELRSAATVAFYISAIGFPVSLLVGALASVPKAAQRFDLSTRVAVVFSTAGSLATLAMVLLGKGLVGVALASLIVNILTGLVYLRVARGLLPGTRLRLRLDLAVLRGLARFAGWFLVATFGVTVLYQLDKLLLGALVGVAAVTYYVVPGNLANRIQGLLGAATQIVFPASAALLARGSHAALVTLYRDGSRLTFLFAATLGVPMAAFARPFLTYWLGGDFPAESTTAMVLLVCTYVLLGMTGVVWGLAFGAGRARANAMFALGMGAVDIALFLVLVGPYQVTGAAAAYFLSALLGVPVLIAYVERRVVRLRGWEFLVEYARVLPAVVVQAAIGLGLAQVVSGLLVTLVAMAGTAVALPILYLLSGLAAPRDRALLGQFIGRIARG
jgi:O-antigen/teichoic acid export membrane protein